MNASLTLQAHLDQYSHVAMDYDEKLGTLTFVPLNEDTYQGQPAHRLVSDGSGGKSAGRAVYLNIDVLPVEEFPTDRYDATLKRGDKFSIVIGKQAR